MRFTYKNKDYELAELVEPNKNETFDIIAVLEIHYCIWVGDELVETTKVDFEANDDHYEKMAMVTYFYGADGDDEELIESAKNLIDERL